jgi:hypothetical protein
MGSAVATTGTVPRREVMNVQLVFCLVSLLSAFASAFAFSMCAVEARSIRRTLLFVQVEAEKVSKSACAHPSFIVCRDGSLECTECKSRRPEPKESQEQCNHCNVFLNVVTGQSGIRRLECPRCNRYWSLAFPPSLLKRVTRNMQS